MQRTPLHNCWATATPQDLQFHKQESVHRTLHTVVREENQKIL